MPQTTGAESAALINEVSPETRSKIRVIHILLTLFTIGVVLTTVISAVIFHTDQNSLAANAFFATTLSLIVISQGFMLFWYFRGDLDPKFRYYLYYAAFSTLLICIAGNLFYHLPVACEKTCPTCAPPPAPQAPTHSPASTHPPVTPAGQL
ncbi:transmembrane protein 243-like [Sycon ciliatum]|uniref:transmembrane protein 243-like n=1 Tax=Sycon ciliatum TaxID=27933 RepID=UPI0020AB2726|eukprot:scpid93642/ scgid33407/ Transmembrane protein C7orf23